MNTFYKLLKGSFTKLPSPQLTSTLTNILHSFKKSLANILFRSNKPRSPYKPTLYLYHPFSQVVYNIAEKHQVMDLQREKVFF